jgi:hypothetical protein
VPVGIVSFLRSCKTIAKLQLGVFKLGLRMEAAYLFLAGAYYDPSSRWPHLTVSTLFEDAESIPELQNHLVIAKVSQPVDSPLQRERSEREGPCPISEENKTSNLSEKTGEFTHFLQIRNFLQASSVSNGDETKKTLHRIIPLRLAGSCFAYMSRRCSEHCILSVTVRQTETVALGYPVVPVADGLIS